MSTDVAYSLGKQGKLFARTTDGQPAPDYILNLM
jgi:hypothetical protein